MCNSQKKWCTMQLGSKGTKHAWLAPLNHMRNKEDDYGRCCILLVRCCSHLFICLAIVSLQPTRNAAPSGFNWKFTKLRKSDRWKNMKLNQQNCSAPMPGFSIVPESIYLFEIWFYPLPPTPPPQNKYFKLCIYIRLHLSNLLKLFATSAEKLLMFHAGTAV